MENTDLFFVRVPPGGEVGVIKGVQDRYMPFFKKIYGSFAECCMSGPQIQLLFLTVTNFL